MLDLVEEVRRAFLELAPDICLGAANVCDAASASHQHALLPSLSGKCVTTLVIAITQLLSDAHPLILRAVLAHPQVSRVLVLSAVSEHAHACQDGPSGDLGPEAFKEYGAMLQQDVQDMREANVAFARHQQQQASHDAASPQPPNPLSVEVRALPLCICALDRSSFVLPAKGAAAMQARVGGTAAGFARPQTSGSDLAGDGHEDDREDEGQIGEGASNNGSGSGGLSLLAHELVGLAAQLGMQLETFSVGVVSHQLALEVCNLPSPSPLPLDLPGRPTPTLGLVLVDRSLDVATPCMHQENLWEMMLGMLPREASTPAASSHLGGGGGPGKRRHRSKAAWRPVTPCVELPEAAPLQCPLPAHFDTTQHPHIHSSQQTQEQQQRPHFYGAEVLCPCDKQAVARLEQVAAKRSKDAAVLVRKWLKQALSTEKLHPNAALRQRSIATLGMACAHAMTGEGCARWEAMASLERQLLQMLLTVGEEGGSSSAVLVLIDALHTAQAGKGSLHVTDVVQLLPFVYSLTPDVQRNSNSREQVPKGPFSHEDEAQLRLAVLQALKQAMQQQQQQQRGHHCVQQPAGPTLQGTSSSGSRESAFDELLPGVGDEGSLEARLDAFFRRLHWIAQARGQLQELRQVTVTDMFADNAGSVLPLLRQLVRRLAQGDPVADIVQASSGSLKTLLTKGLGRFGLDAGLLGAVAGAVAPRAARVSECTAVLIFVVGGISPAEIREVRQEIEERPSVRLPPLLLGGTALLTSSDVARQLMQGS
ncbi:hypothetical protein DUNSADRAFT_9942 [Dunaliella salina]|uniref:Uncharacterized protein n=1 Tax=Dunaliella salina TaxID=3046 RepID=A0ABQ7GGE5_DUNSA|nr:hypothetical protein DUNSADRAFT_9942 [Dunaliella salina]|eukprot:KAF5833671.1 hypothetical protein DUNSADRAFT_9942 [Dunaliella salina]